MKFVMFIIACYAWDIALTGAFNYFFRDEEGKDE